MRNEQITDVNIFFLQLYQSKCFEKLVMVLDEIKVDIFLTP